MNTIKLHLKKIKFLKFLYCWIIAIISPKREKRILYGPWFYLHCMKNKKKYHKLAQYKNVHKGKRCFIVGTGPSLLIEDVNKLKGEISFGVNTLFKLYDRTDWRADYYCMIDPNTYHNLESEMREKQICDVFYPDNQIQSDFLNGPTFALNHSDIYKLCMPRLFKFTEFSADIEKKVYDGASVIYAAMQIAVYMGITEIYLLGVDCNYSVDCTRHGEELAYSNYKYNWTEDTALTMIEGFKVAREYADKHGIKIYNATRGGMLEVFERVNIDDIVGDRI